MSFAIVVGAADNVAGAQALTTEASAANPEFVGGRVCAGCHEREHALWSGSDHDRAMQVANEQTVLGDFEQSSYTHHGLSSTFYRRDGKFLVRTEGSDGELGEYEIAYTFGVRPLQQYLIAFPGGRYQALGIAWDSRPAAEGGQRWFHIYGDEQIPHGDELHWTGRNQNWNFMCAGCHSTNLRRNYDLKADTYATTWSEIDVSCEACHGPGSLHAAWAAAWSEGQDDLTGKGLLAPLGDPNGGRWLRQDGADTAHRSVPLAVNSQVEACGRCHSRRRELTEEYVHGQPLTDTHLPQLLSRELYHPDGQIDDEVYVYGSFVQSKMYRAGVTCSDCHEPHSGRLHAQGNALCTRCHAAEKFDTSAHHFHTRGSKGAACVECHMPVKNYMVVDARRDHSLRIPRPDLTLELGTPSACNRCHSNESAEWAATEVARWAGTDKHDSHFGETLKAGRDEVPGLDRALAELAGDGQQAAIVRATALALLENYPTQTTLGAIQSGVKDDSPLVRIAALGALEGVPPRFQLPLAIELLDDPIRAVRVSAARIVAPVTMQQLSRAHRAFFTAAFDEYVQTELANAERPSSHLNLGNFYVARSAWREAEAAYKTALRLEPEFVPALINLADLYRAQKRDGEGEPLLRQALKAEPENAGTHHALGLLYVRSGRHGEALESLERSAALRPQIARYSYVYGVALNSRGEVARALTVLESANERHPYDRDILLTLVSIHRDNDDIDRAIYFAEALALLNPKDQQARELLEDLRSLKK